MNHCMPVDFTGVAIGWFTYCGKHAVFLPKADHIVRQSDTVDCPKCKERMPHA